MRKWIVCGLSLWVVFSSSAFSRDLGPVPDKVQPDGSVENRSLFSEEEIESGDFVLAKDAIRRQIMVQGLQAPAAEAYGEGRVGAFVEDEGYYATLEEMEENQLLTAQMSVKPWSDTYWPLFEGTLGVRYADPLFPRDPDWKTNYNYVEEHPFAEIIAKGNPDEVDALSPSEKYQAWVGDWNGKFSEAMWETGKHYFERYNEVESWFGICHGWAPASYMMSRPTHAVTVQSADGKTSLKFYPSDIKGLASYLWATVPVPHLFLGGRCQAKDPELDENGRVVDRDCFDTNPGIWHMAIVNRLGKNHLGMVFDASYDYEVWNQPVYGYRYHYFNPISGEDVSSLGEATVDRAAYVADPYKKYRSAKTKRIVGIKMELDYIVESSPRAEEVSLEDPFSVRTVTYRYDLELNERGKIIGGEWYTNFHPDFIWSPPSHSRPTTVWDRSIDQYLQNGGVFWNPNEILGNPWKKAALGAVQMKAPLARLVETLIEFSRP